MRCGGAVNIAVLPDLEEVYQFFHYLGITFINKQQRERTDRQLLKLIPTQ